MRFTSLPAEPLTVGIAKLNFVGERGPLGNAAIMRNPRSGLRVTVYKNFKAYNIHDGATTEALLHNTTATGCVLFGSKGGRLLPSDQQTWLFPSAGWISLSSVNPIRLQEAGSRRYMLFRILSELRTEPALRHTRPEETLDNIDRWGAPRYRDILAELDWQTDLVAREVRNALGDTYSRLDSKAAGGVAISVPFYKLCEWVKNLCGACIFVKYDGRKLKESRELSHLTQPRDISGVFFMRTHEFRLPLVNSNLLSLPKKEAVQAAKDWAYRALRRDIDEYNAYLASDVYTWCTQVNGEDTVLDTPLFYGSDIRTNGLLRCLESVIKIMHPSTTVRLRPDIATVNIGETCAHYNAGDS